MSWNGNATEWPTRKRKAKRRKRATEPKYGPGKSGDRMYQAKLARELSELQYRQPNRPGPKGPPAPPVISMRVIWG